MYKYLKKPCLLYALIAGLGLLLAGRVTAQTFTTLHSFEGSDGAPYAGLTLSSNILYGTTEGGVLQNGTVFKVNADGTDFTNLHSFANTDDGHHPYAGLIISGNTLYGTAARGNGSAYGTVFGINTVSG